MVGVQLQIEESGARADGSGFETSSFYTYRAGPARGTQYKALSDRRRRCCYRKPRRSAPAPARLPPVAPALYRCAGRLKTIFLALALENTQDCSSGLVLDFRRKQWISRPSSKFQLMDMSSVVVDVVRDVGDGYAVRGRLDASQRFGEQIPFCEPYW